MNSRVALFALSLLGAALAAAPAAAHPEGGTAVGFAHGFAHPLGGLDHLLAMVAVGLWAGHLGGGRILLVPAAFVAFLIVGALFGIAGVGFPLVEVSIAASVLLFGLLVAVGARLPLWAGLAVTGLFAIAHGHAHGAEMLPAAGAAAYVVGFALATAMIHGLGIGLCLGMRRMQLVRASLPVGTAIAAAGAVLLVIRL